MSDSTPASVLQDLFGDGSDGARPGNCLQACYAALLGLELEEVPHLVEQAVNQAKPVWVVELDWLRSRGLGLAYFPAEHWPQLAPGTPYMATVTTTRGLSHAVLCRDGEVIHDPHPEGGPDTITEVHGGYLVVSLAPWRST